MNFKSPAFEKALRGLVREEIRLSPGLWRERKRVGKRRRNAPPVVVFVLLTCLGFGFLAAGYARSPEFAAGLLALLGTLLLFVHIGKLRVGLFSDPALPIFDGLPLTSEQVFDHQWRIFTRGTIGTGLFFAVAYVGFGLFAKFGPAQFLGAILAAALQGLLVYAVSMLLLSRLPGCRFEGVTSMLGYLPIPLVVAGNIFGERAFLLLDPLIRLFAWLTPSGWLNSLFLHGVVQGDLLWFALVIPVTLLAATVPSSRRRLWEMHGAREPVYFRWPEFTAEEAKDEPPRLAAVMGLPTPTRTGPTEIEESIRARQFLLEPVWPKAGLLEDWVARWLTPRELAVAAFVFLYPPGWTAAWKRSAKFLLITLILSLIPARFVPAWFLPVFGIGGLVVAFLALPISDLNWWGFHSFQVGAVGTPIHALYPFNYGEIARVLFKAAAVRALASLPLLAALGAFGAWHYGARAIWGALFGGHVALLYLCLNPMLMALAFSSQTSDYKVAGLRSWVFVVPFVSGIFLVLILTILELGLLGLTPGIIRPLLLTPIIAACCYALYRWHRFAYDRCWFDTLKIARPT